MKYSKLTFLFCFTSFLCFGQREAKYCQADASPYADNCFIFKKLKPGSKTGTFEQIMEFDDGQKFYGKGKFVQSENKITFSRYMLVRKEYNFKGDSVLKCDTSIVPGGTFYKKGKYLIEYDPRQKGGKKRSKTLYVKS